LRNYFSSAESDDYIRCLFTFGKALTFAKSARQHSNVDYYTGTPIYRSVLQEPNFVGRRCNCRSIVKSISHLLYCAAV